MIGAILLAAGRGVRFGGETAKQFLSLHGRPVYQHAVLRYARAGLVDEIVLLVPAPALAQVTADVAALGTELPVHVRAGGATRDLSIRAGLAALHELQDADRYSRLILHNAASPNTDVDTIRRCLAALDDDEVAQACLPETRTQFLTDGDHAVRMLPRDQVVISCDPTAYRAPALMELLRFKEETGLENDTTTDTALRLGFRVALVRSHPGNVKVTGPWDLEMLAAAMRGERPADKPVAS